MTENTFNGWINYETWVVALWLDNEKTSYDYWREQATRCRREAADCDQVRAGTWTAEEAARFNLADQIKEEVTNHAPLTDATVCTDLLNAALGEVDWSEIAANLLDEIQEREEQNHDPAGPVIASYSRAQAIEDGVLIDVSEMANETGISYPTAMTAAAWERFVKVPEGVEGQDERGRLWDVLNMFYCAARRGPKGDTVLFDVLVKNDNTAPRPLALKAVCSPGDTPAAVVTIMLPRED